MSDALKAIDLAIKIDRKANDALDLIHVCFHDWPDDLKAVMFDAIAEKARTMAERFRGS